jgi:hypothetical protein
MAVDVAPGDCKSIVFMEGHHRRAVAGTTDDPCRTSFGDGVVRLAVRAEAPTRGA